MYSQLVAALKALSNVSFTENEWGTRPATDHGTVQIDFAAAQDEGDGVHENQAYQGSVDLYTHGRATATAQAVEGVLETHCGASWYMNLETYEHETGLLHREYVFELEMM